MDFLANISPFLGFGGLAVAWFIYKEVRDRPDGNDRMREIAGYIYEGAMAFLKREYRILGYFVLIVFVLLTVSISWRTAIAFVSGASCSVLAGLFGMQAATKANVHTSQAAKDQGEGEALLTAFDGGAVMGLSVASLPPLQIIVTDPAVVIGLFIGGILPFFIGALTMTAIGRAASQMVDEIRRQFRDIPGLLEGRERYSPAFCF